ncbi:hypothetical protein SMA679_0518 [Streptococcus macedonicus]|nr:hypothetical protein SMA679_0518 [Streptococcus macedonicus]
MFSEEEKFLLKITNQSSSFLISSIRIEKYPTKMIYEL